MFGVMNKWNKAGLRLIAFMGIVCMAFLTGAVWMYTVRRQTTGEVQIEKDLPGGNLLYFLAAAALAYGIYKVCGYVNQKLVHIATLLITFGIICGLFYLIKEASAVQLVADPAQVFFGAEYLIDGRYEELGSFSYFWVYPHQLQLSKFFAGIIQVFGRPVWESVILIQYVNAVCAGVTFYVGARIARELSADAGVEALYILEAVLFLPMYIYALFVYGEAIGVCGAVLAVYFFILCNREKEQPGWQAVLYWTGMALSLWTAYIMRPALAIVWIAAVIIEFLVCLRKKKWLPMLCVLLVLGCVLGGQRLYNYSIVKNTGISLDGGAPAILWIAMGMQGEEEISKDPGGYNGYNWSTFTGCEYDAGAAAEQAKADIGRRLEEWRAHPGRMLRFYKNKTLNQWAEPSYSAYSSTRMMSEPADWVIDHWYNEEHAFAYDRLNNYQSAAYLLLLIYFIHMAFVKTEERVYFPGLILIGGFLFSLIWEAQSRYTYPYIVFTLPCMAAGMKYCLDDAGKVLKKAGGVFFRKDRIAGKTE